MVATTAMGRVRVYILFTAIAGISVTIFKTSFADQDLADSCSALWNGVGELTFLITPVAMQGVY
jgi:hypothetical protein